MEQRTTVPQPSDPYAFCRLLEKVVIAASADSEDGLPQALAGIRDRFSFSTAFIYEHDPFGLLIMREHANSPGHEPLPDSFALSDVLSPDEIDGLVDDPALYLEDQGDPDRPLRGRFATNGMLIVLIADESDAVVGCAGMAGRRSDAPFGADELAQADVLFRPIAERSRLRICKRKLGYTASTLESIMDHIGFDIYVNDFDTHEMLYANKSMAAPYGGWDAMKGRRCFEALYDDRHEECPYCPKKHLIDENGFPSKMYSWDYQRPFDGTWFRVLSTAFRWTDGRLAQVVSSTDINEAKNNELLIKRMAYSDMLTGIPNRRKLEEDFHEALARSKGDGKGIAILFMDLDRFKQVNDKYGHNGGDALLKHVSGLLLESTLTAGCCYRYGGDEFIFLFEDTSVERARRRGEAILEMLESPFFLEGDELSCSGSIGLAHYPEDGTNYWDLLDKADEAMYIDKQRGRRARA